MFNLTILILLVELGFRDIIGDTLLITCAKCVGYSMIF